MRIDPQIPVPENSNTTRVNGSQSNASKSQSTPSGSDSNDTVHLSSDQATVRQLVSQLNQVPAVRQDKVNALRTQVQSGQFKPSNDQVAGAIVSQLFGNNQDT